MNWTYLIIGLLCLVILIDIIKIFATKPNVINELDSVKMTILAILPELISGVEIPGNGADKKIMVIKLVHAVLEKMYGLKNYDSLDSFISDAIESILKTPKKKEVN